MLWSKKLHTLQNMENLLICEPNSIIFLSNVYVQHVHFMYLIRNTSMVFKYCDICEVVVVGV